MCVHVSVGACVPCMRMCVHVIIYMAVSDFMHTCVRVCGTVFLFFLYTDKKRKKEKEPFSQDSFKLLATKKVACFVQHKTFLIIPAREKLEF